MLADSQKKELISDKEKFSLLSKEDQIDFIKRKLEFLINQLEK